MKKLNLKVVTKILTKNLTDTEVDFMITISHYQNQQGHIQRIYYKNICKAINISFQTFYDTVKGLENKGIIKTAREHCKISICDNEVMEHEGTTN